jgi:spore coat polysaccharide biosynthesis predicted glycosyltransferase SpsG
MRIVFRTEGSHQQGMGDVMGSLALADECAKQADEILFVLSGGDEAVAAIMEKGYRWQTAPTWEAEQNILTGFCPDVIVVNKLNSPPEYVRSLKAHAGMVVTMDDAGEGAQYADLRVNPLYDAPAAVTDPQYIALRREFQETHSRSKTISGEVRELLITQGGSDTYGFTPGIIRALEGLKIRPHCTVVIGPAFRHKDDLRDAVAASTLDLTVVRNVRDMAERMWKADLAITAGGLGVFELLCVGTPSLVVCGEWFEVETASKLEKSGAVVNLGFGGDLNGERLREAVEALAKDAKQRKELSLRGKQLVDGRGCERIVELITRHAMSVKRSER